MKAYKTNARLCRCWQCSQQITNYHKLNIFHLKKKLIIYIYIKLYIYAQYISRHSFAAQQSKLAAMAQLSVNKRDFEPLLLGAVPDVWLCWAGIA
jgi:hypothetical protein